MKTILEKLARTIVEWDESDAEVEDFPVKQEWLEESGLDLLVGEWDRDDWVEWALAIYHPEEPKE